MKRTLFSFKEKRRENNIIDTLILFLYALNSYKSTRILDISIMKKNHHTNLHKTFDKKKEKFIIKP